MSGRNCGFKPTAQASSDEVISWQCRWAGSLRSFHMRDSRNETNVRSVQGRSRRTEHGFECRSQTSGNPGHAAACPVDSRPVAAGTDAIVQARRSCASETHACKPADHQQQGGERYDNGSKHQADQKHGRFHRELSRIEWNIASAQPQGVEHDHPAGACQDLTTVGGRVTGR